MIYILQNNIIVEVNMIFINFNHFKSSFATYCWLWLQFIRNKSQHLQHGCSREHMAKIYTQIKQYEHTNWIFKISIF